MQTLSYSHVSIKKTICLSVMYCMRNKAVGIHRSGFRRPKTHGSKSSSQHDRCHAYDARIQWDNTASRESDVLELAADAGSLSRWCHQQLVFHVMYGTSVFYLSPQLLLAALYAKLVVRMRSDRRRREVFAVRGDASLHYMIRLSFSRPYHQSLCTSHIPL